MSVQESQSFEVKALNVKINSLRIAVSNYVEKWKSDTMKEYNSKIDAAVNNFFEGSFKELRSIKEQCEGMIDTCERLERSTVN